MKTEEFIRRLPFDKLKIYPNQNVFILDVGTEYPRFVVNMLKAMWDDALELKKLPTPTNMEAAIDAVIFDTFFLGCWRMTIPDRLDQFKRIVLERFRPVQRMNTKALKSHVLPSFIYEELAEGIDWDEVLREPESDSESASESESESAPTSTQIPVARQTPTQTSNSFQDPESEYELDKTQDVKMPFKSDSTRGESRGSGSESRSMRNSTQETEITGATQPLDISLAQRTRRASRYMRRGGEYMVNSILFSNPAYIFIGMNLLARALAEPMKWQEGRRWSPAKLVWDVATSSVAWYSKGIIALRFYLGKSLLMTGFVYGVTGFIANTLFRNKSWYRRISDRQWTSLHYLKYFLNIPLLKLISIYTGYGAEIVQGLDYMFKVPFETLSNTTDWGQELFLNTTGIDLSILSNASTYPAMAALNPIKINALANQIDAYLDNQLNDILIERKLDLGIVYEVQGSNAFSFTKDEFMKEYIVPSDGSYKYSEKLLEKLQNRTQFESKRGSPTNLMKTLPEFSVYNRLTLENLEGILTDKWEQKLSLTSTEIDTNGFKERLFDDLRNPQNINKLMEEYRTYRNKLSLPKLEFGSLPESLPSLEYISDALQYVKEIITKQSDSTPSDILLDNGDARLNAKGMEGIAGQQIDELETKCNLKPGTIKWTMIDSARFQESYQNTFNMCEYVRTQNIDPSLLFNSQFESMSNAAQFLLAKGQFFMTDTDLNNYNAEDVINFVNGTLHDLPLNEAYRQQFFPTEYLPGEEEFRKDYSTDPNVITQRINGILAGNNAIGSYGLSGFIGEQLRKPVKKKNYVKVRL